LNFADRSESSGRECFLEFAASQSQTIVTFNENLLTLALNGPGDNAIRMRQVAFVDICHVAAFETPRLTGETNNFYSKQLASMQDIG
jgi:hypothetical protein